MASARNAHSPAKSRVAGSGDSRNIRRAFAIFELLLAEGEPLSVAEMIARLRIPKSTFYELVRTLTETGYLERADRGGGLFLGRRLFELGMAYRARTDLLRDGAPIVEALRDATGETAQLSVLDADNMLVLLKEEGSQPLRIISKVGSRVPPNWAAAGRLLISDLDDTQLIELLHKTTAQSPSGQAVTDIETLAAQVRKYRKRGYATELNEANLHAGCVAAPVVDASGRCVAAISVVAPEQRLGRTNRQRLIDEVRKAAARLSNRLGGP